MYTHTFNNPNNIKINDLYNYDIVPIGNRCYTASSCIRANLRVYSLPFDWICHTLPSTLKEILENDFNGFIPDVINSSFINKYDISFPHFDEDIDKGILDTTRRIERFKTLLKSSPKIYFIHLSFDYIIDKSWQTNEFNHNLMSNFVDLDYFLRKKYPHLNYTLIVFTFKKYDYLPRDSNIFQIVLTCNEPYNFDSFDEKKFTKMTHELIEHCGNILKQLFKV
jgi:hypothetical protein